MLHGLGGHPLVWGLAAGFTVWIFLHTTGLGRALPPSSVSFWTKAVNSVDAIVAVTFAGTTVGKKAGGDWIDKKLKGPWGSLKTALEISVQPTEEERAEKAWEAYKGLIMTEGAPEGSAGDDINKAIDRFLDFSIGKTTIGEGTDLPKRPDD